MLAVRVLAEQRSGEGLRVHEGAEGAEGGEGSVRVHDGEANRADEVGTDRGLEGSGFLFVIDINNCAEKGYAIIDNRYSYASIETVRASRANLWNSRIAGKDFIYIVIKPNKEGKKKQLLFKVVKRDDCVEELNAKMKRELWDVCCRQIFCFLGLLTLVWS